MYLLDTNVVSELRKVSRINPAVRSWNAQVATEDQFISSITILEIEVGIMLLSRRHPEQASQLTNWLEELVLPGFDGRILPVDVSVARQCAALHVPDPRSPNDVLIGATALAHNLILVTRNLKDFEGFGVRLLNPWVWIG